MGATYDAGADDRLRPWHPAGIRSGGRQRRLRPWRNDGTGAEEQVRLRADIQEFRPEPKADIAIVAENTHSLNRKLNILLVHMGLPE
ncbi:hypothetical protein IGS68_22595 [Skermanella sp. TT6]|uniref:Uncharacterized protein n=1 Tax=Skermanella cutis TaxID=2775420 RepID=A0ABX7B3R1_9PROT|nr:hypothetical protein [Skermanella sp. TT6]QQP88774.1 hypothetical protein IGS68_22595 [Skermanella sp. TT6]